MGSVSVSSCRCCMFVSCEHPVAVLNAAFCMTCSLLMLVEDAIGDHRVQNGSPGSTRFYGPVPPEVHWSVPVSTGPYILGRPVNSQDADNLHTIRKRMPIPFQ